MDRPTWTLASTPDLGRATAGGTFASDGTSIYVPAADSSEVLVIDPSSFTVSETLDPSTRGRSELRDITELEPSVVDHLPTAMEAPRRTPENRGWKHENRGW